jgi:hypothetical protein
LVVGLADRSLTVVVGAGSGRMGQRAEGPLAACVKQTAVAGETGKYESALS